MKKKTYLSNFIWMLMVMGGMQLTACNNSRSDESIQEDVTQKLTSEEGHAAYTGVNAEVKDGVVTINGQCATENCVDSVAALVQEVDGVKEVVNNVKYAQAETDLTLRTSVQTIASKYEGVQADVAGGVVVLRGIIPREQLQPLMNELGTLNAKKIDNQLAVK